VKCESEIELNLHPDIHPEDAKNALHAWLKRTLHDRKKLPHIILEKALIASALKYKSHRDVFMPPVWKDGKGREIKRRDDDFERRWKRARKDGREPIWDKIDDFILKNWRVMRPLGDFHFDLNVPGLNEWSPRAVTALIRSLPMGEKMCAEGRRIENDETWYVKKRNRLGLHGQRRYRVHDFLLNKDGFARIDID
jgi:hypothetical protein